MKLKEIFDQSDTIIEPWPDFEANCFRVGGPCRSAFKGNTLIYSFVISDNDPLENIRYHLLKFCVLKLIKSLHLIKISE